MKKLIMSTEDYTFFKTIKGNRGVKDAHVKRLKDAIEKDTSCIKYNPILINEKNEVIDGQHRKKAIMELGLPVYYIQETGLTLDNVQSLNSLSKSWTPRDYALSYSELGNKNYDVYLEFKKEFDLNHDILLTYLGLSNNISPIMFNTGKLKVEDRDKSYKLCEMLLELGQFYPNYYRRSFALASIKMFLNPMYDHKYMIGKMKTRGAKIQDFARPQDYMRALEEVYNISQRSKEKHIRIF